MKTESLQPGRGTPQPGATHEANAGLPFLGSGSEAGAGGEARDLGPGEAEEMFGPAATPRQRLEAQGVEFVESEAERGGGGDAIDAIDDWVVNQRGGYDKLLQQIEQNKWGDDLVWKLPDGTQLSVAEVKRRAVVAASPPAPEPQLAPRPGDWRDNLQKDQKERLNEFEINVSKFDVAQLQGLLSRIKQLQALAPIDGWQGKGIREEDAASCLRVIIERIEEISEQREVVGDIRSIARVARITGWRPPPDEFDPEIDLSTGGTNGT